jgi:hypothetical protein
VTSLIIDRSITLFCPPALRLSNAAVLIVVDSELAEKWGAHAPSEFEFLNQETRKPGKIKELCEAMGERTRPRVSGECASRSRTWIPPFESGNRKVKLLRYSTLPLNRALHGEAAHHRKPLFSTCRPHFLI